MIGSDGLIFAIGTFVTACTLTAVWLVGQPVSGTDPADLKEERAEQRTSEAPRSR